MACIDAVGKCFCFQCNPRPHLCTDNTVLNSTADVQKIEVSWFFSPSVNCVLVYNFPGSSEQNEYILPFFTISARECKEHEKINYCLLGFSSGR